MYYYAAFVAFSNPEDTVRNFYEAYFNEDFNKAAENVSVFWSAQFLPQYMSLEPRQMIANRAAIQRDTAVVLEGFRANDPVPEGIELEILSSYTRKSDNAALVAFKFVREGEPAGFQAAILIKEKYSYLIYNTTPIAESSLDEINKVDLKALNNNFKQLLGKK
jgi:hypothetical protein